MKGKPKNVELRAKAMALRLSGLSYSAVGKALGISQQRACQMLRPPAEIHRIVKRRANGVCEGCSIPVNNGHVHHKKYTEIKEEDYSDLPNLQYLCASCHAKIHDAGVMHRPTYDYINRMPIALKEVVIEPEPELAADHLPYNPFEGMAIPSAIPDTRPTVARIVQLRKAGENTVRGAKYYSVMCVIPRVVLTVTGIDFGDAVLVMGWPDGTIMVRRAGEGGVTAWRYLI